MDCKFVNGQRVVCVDDTDWSDKDVLDAWYAKQTGSGARWPVKGQVYTIRSIEWSERLATPCLKFAEIVNAIVPTQTGLGELAFGADRFKPLDETRLDVFRSLLTPTKTKEKTNG
jgi:hypothetical protein